MTIDRRGFVHGSAALGALAAYSPEQAMAKTVSEPVPALNTDAMFNDPFVDVDEWRDTPFRHRYIHGGFKGTDAKFVMYFPPKEIYQGRFFQPIPPVPLPEETVIAMFGGGLDNTVGFAFDSGGAAVASNLGGFAATANPSSKTDPTIAGFRVSAATARYARVMANKIYGSHRTYGYCFGGSGGGYRSISNLQNSDAFDGGVPFMHPCPAAIPNGFAARVRAQRVLKGKFPQIADALEPGGGDPFAGLNPEQREVLTEVTRHGFPIRTWAFYETMGIGALAILYQTVLEKDPAYFSDFWTKPGYLGHDRPELFAGVRLQHRARIKRVIRSDEAAAAGLRAPGRLAPGSADPAVAWQALQKDYGGALPVALELDSAPAAGQDLTGFNILVNSGASAGKLIVLGGMSGNFATFQFGPASGSLRDITDPIRPGDEVQIDNSNFLAFETYYRHTLQGRDAYVGDQFRRPDGTPIYPQRTWTMNAEFVQAGMGSQVTSNFHGKMIILQYLLDWDAHGWFADWYRARVRETLGPNLTDRYRLYYVDHCTHGQAPDPTRTVPYIGALQQALRDVSAWAERGVEPMPETSYRVVDGQVLVPDAATARKGIQATVAVQANGGTTARVRAGQAVTFTAVVEAPSGAGLIVAAEWDFTATAEVVAGDAGRFPVKETVAPAKRVKLSRTYTFDKPGTYFPALRIHSHRQANTTSRYARVANLGRVRVVVT